MTDQRDRRTTVDGPVRIAAPTDKVGQSVVHMPGEEGIWVFIFGDMTVFALFFATYLFYRGQNVSLFNSSQTSLVRGFGVANTLVLLCSSLAVCFGMRAIRRRRDDGTHAAAPFVVALACGVIFTGLKVMEYSQKLSLGITPVTNKFFMYYFVLTGVHFFHLLIGMAVLGYLISAARRDKLSDRQFAFVEGGACYWHMVDLLWIVVFALLYLVK